MNAFTDAIARAEAKGWKEGAKRMKGERQMAGALVRECLKQGYLISVNNGEDWPIRRSRSYRAVMDALWQTDEEGVCIYDADGRPKGHFFLVYGNSGAELVCDYSDNDACNAVYDALRPLMDRLEA